MLFQEGDDDQKVQTSSYKLNNSQRCNIQHGDYIVLYIQKLLRDLI